jgi:L-fucose isomerase-like protein
MQLLERFGIEVIPVTLIEIQALYEETLKNRRNDLQKLVEHYKRDFETKVEDENLLRTAALNLTIRRWADELQVDGIASSCWGPMREIAGIASCFTFSELTGEHLPVICETDIHGAISSVMAQAATHWEKASFLADITMRHPVDNNAELLWHCGVFPGTTACSDCKPSISCSFDESRPTVGEFRLEGGDITICRFDATNDDYGLFMAQGKGVEGPATKGTYGWFEFKNWPRIEHKLVYGPYIHHCAGIHAKISPALFEACKYISGLHPDPIEPEKEEIEAYLI